MTLQEGYLKTYSHRVRKILTKEEKIKAKDLYEKARDKDSKMVKGMIKNLECPGNDVEFMYKIYNEDPWTTYTFKDGSIETIPLGVAKHINNIKKVTRDYAISATGEKTLATVVTGSEQKYQFLSLDYM